MIFWLPLYNYLNQIYPSTTENIYLPLIRLEKPKLKSIIRDWRARWMTSPSAEPDGSSRVLWEATVDDGRGGDGRCSSGLLHNWLCGNTHGGCAARTSDGMPQRPIYLGCLTWPQRRPLPPGPRSARRDDPAGVAYVPVVSHASPWLVGCIVSRAPGVIAGTAAWRDYGRWTRWA